MGSAGQKEVQRRRREGANNNAKSASNQINSNVTKNIHILSTFVGRSLATANSPATPSPPKWLGPPQSQSSALPCSLSYLRPSPLPSSTIALCNYEYFGQICVAS